MKGELSQLMFHLVYTFVGSDVNLPVTSDFLNSKGMAHLRIPIFERLKNINK